jgi:hypothetical protein
MKGIITLCGSTKFPEAFKEANAVLTKSDWIVLSIGTVVRQEYHDENNPKALALKERLDRLHKEKIAISQGIVVLNVNGYYGSSTKSEIEYARKLGKAVYWLNPDFLGFNHSDHVILELIDQDQIQQALAMISSSH